MYEKTKILAYKYIDNKYDKPQLSRIITAKRKILKRIKDKK